VKSVLRRDDVECGLMWACSAFAFEITLVSSFLMPSVTVTLRCLCLQGSKKLTTVPGPEPVDSLCVVFLLLKGKLS